MASDSTVPIVHGVSLQSQLGVVVVLKNTSILLTLATRADMPLLSLVARQRSCIVEWTVVSFGNLTLLLSP
jgi:hypothetical protein